MNVFYRYLESPLGLLELRAGVQGLEAINFVEGRFQPETESELLQQASRQLEEYFGGRRRDFELPLAPCGTTFQQRVWQALRQLSYGQTCSYADIAAAIGKPAAVRAVGAANGRNPLAIVVPCHRVIGANGTLTGYAGGLQRKAWLLALERGEELLP